MRIFCARSIASGSGGRCHLWLPGTTSVEPDVSVKSSSAQIVVTLQQRSPVSGCGGSLCSRWVSSPCFLVTVHRLIHEAHLAFRIVLVDGGRDVVGLVVVGPHAVVGGVEDTRAHGQLAIIDDDVEGGHVIRVAEVRRRVREDLVRGAARAAQGVPALRDPGRKVGAGRLHPLLRGELDAVRVADRRSRAHRQRRRGKRTSRPTPVHHSLLNSPHRHRPRFPRTRPCRGPGTGCAVPWRSR